MANSEPQPARYTLELDRLQRQARRLARRDPRHRLIAAELGRLVNQYASRQTGGFHVH